MTCKDCIHSEICKYRYRPLPLCDCTYDESNKIEKSGCPFADKSRFIELPCKVGDKVYMYNRNKTKIQEMVLDIPDIRCHCTRDDEYACCMPVCIDHQNGICAHRFSNDFREIGKTVFLTREEAEKALKECENNARNIV